MIKAHEKAIEILEAIKYFKRQVYNHKKNLDMDCCRYLPSIRKHYEHQLDISQRSLKRMQLYYHKFMAENFDTNYNKSESIYLQYKKYNENKNSD